MNGREEKTTVVEACDLRPRLAGEQSSQSSDVENMEMSDATENRRMLHEVLRASEQKVSGVCCDCASNMDVDARKPLRDDASSTKVSHLSDDLCDDLQRS